MKNTIELAATSKLATNLSKYGLNPKQWKLQKTNKNTYWIRHKSLNTWCFKGTTISQSNDQDWSSISLISL